MSAKQYFDIYKSSAYYYYYLHMYTKHKENKNKKKTIANKTKANTNLAAYFIFADICQLGCVLDGTYLSLYLSLAAFKHFSWS